MKGRKTTVETKTRRVTLLMELMLCIVCLIIFYGKENDNLILANILTIVIIGLVLILSGEIFYRVFWKIFKDEEKREESKTLVDKVLSTRQYIAVNPIAATDYEDFILSLTGRAQFYAILSEDDDRVAIFLKFNNEETYILLEKLTKDYFTSYYEIRKE